MPKESEILSADEFQELCLSDAILATDRYEALLVKVAALTEERDEETQLRERLAELLRGVAYALKGEPPTLTLHDWWDLPQVAATVKGSRDSAEALATARLREIAVLEAGLRRLSDAITNVGASGNPADVLEVFGANKAARALLGGVPAAAPDPDNVDAVLRDVVPICDSAAFTDRCHTCGSTNRAERLLTRMTPNDMEREGLTDDDTAPYVWDCHDEWHDGETK